MMRTETGWLLGGCFSTTLLAGACLLLLGSPGYSQAPGDGNRLLDQVKAASEIRAQKVEADVRDALREADRWARTDASRSRAALEGALLNLQDDTDLSTSRRESMVRVLKDRLNRLAADKVQNDRATTERADRWAAEEARRTDPPRRTGDTGRPAPKTDDPASVASNRITGANDRLGETTRLKTDRDARYASVSDSIQKSMIPAGTEVEFPTNWKELVAKRSSGPRMTAKESAIMKALGTPMDVEFKGDRLIDVIEYLGKKTGTPILLDQEMLERLGSGVSYESKVTVTAKGVTLRTLLRRILGDFNLTYLVLDETVTVLPQEEARKMMIARAYPIADLVGATNSPFGAVGNQVQTIQNINSLIALIYQTIEPSIWQVNGRGGEGTIAFEPQSMSLIIRAPAELHGKLGGAIK